MAVAYRSWLAAGALLAILGSGAGPAAAAPRIRHEEEANRRLVVQFYDRVFNRHDVAGGARVLSDTYRQHNPEVPDGKAPFVSFFTGYFKDNPQAKARIVRSAADGDLVWLHVHSTSNAADRGQSVVDIFRVRRGKIVEHWDVIQDVPDHAANANTMF